MIVYNITIQMITQLCTICGKNNYEVLYPENFDLKKIDERIFSARRLPDKIHYRIVRCKNCGFIYSNPILEYEKIEKLYKKSFTTYEEYLEDLRETYGFYLKGLKKYGVKKGKLLEIGCGNGFFLLEALKQGYKSVYGVEPGKKSVEIADPRIRNNIVIDIFRPGIYKPKTFAVICCFQTLDHIPNPNELLAECRKILKDDGFMLFLNHDIGAWTNRLFGEESPVIDIEHTYLFDQKTIAKIFEKHRFTVLEIKSALNIHRLAYWLTLLPPARPIKKTILSLLGKLKIAGLKVKLYPGNLVLYARKSNGLNQDIYHKQYVFNQDVEELGGYQYTGKDCATRLITEKQNECIVSYLNKYFNKNISILDMGCGDGVFTLEIFKKFLPKKIVAFDLLQKPIEVAKKNTPKEYRKRVAFGVDNVYDFACPKKKFNVGILRFILHHLDHPEKAIANVSKSLDKIIVLEPNGYNLLLKIIEKISPYHRRHKEKSYFPYLLNRWFAKNGFQLKEKKYITLVPCFSPEPVAKALKFFEPLAEKVPIFNKIICGVYLAYYEKK